jgi:SNF2 family DNA or RNA helicase
MVVYTDLWYQTEARELAKDREYFGYFMDRGTAKTRPLLQDAVYNFQKGRIEALLVLCPNSVKTSWVAWPHMLEEGDDPDQVDKHIPDARAIKGVWTSAMTGENKKAWAAFEKTINAKPSRLIVLSVNYEALLGDHVMGFLKDFCKQFRVMICADESTRIGVAKSKRTKRAITLARLCPIRRILTGTPVKKSPMKIYTQAVFLDKQALPFNSQYAFRNRYCIMGGFKNKKILDYQNMDELSDLIAAFSFRKQRLPSEGPPKVYIPRRVDMTTEQAKAYKEMREEFMTNVKGEDITATIVLTQILRLQQICGGYLNKDGKIIEIIPPSRNPKVQETLELLEDLPKCVVWFRFREELAALGSELTRLKIPFFEFHGGLSDKEKVQVRKAFYRGERPYVLATTQTGGIGIDEFKVSGAAIFFSRDFDTEQQEQAEGRTDRVGSQIHDSLAYYDVYVPNSIETKIHRVLRGDAKLSARLLKDQLLAWI